MDNITACLFYGNLIKYPQFSRIICYYEVYIIRKSIAYIFIIFLLFSMIAPHRVSAAEEARAGTVSVEIGPLRVRKSDSTSSAVVATLNKGSYVTLISKEGVWWRVEYARGRYGYCHGNYIHTVSVTAQRVSTQGSPLRVRTGAGTGYSRITSLDNGTSVLVLSQKDGWSRILFDGTKTGYVSSKYLSSQQKYTAVSLNVPHYYQTDNRWANVKLGASGKTIGQIGCTTTALAMMESYRQGKTIYPNTMAKSLQYTSGGSLYWPANYVGVTDKLNLTEIYNLLRSGKPVIVGYYGSTGQHWVVVYGYVGGNTLVESGFLINDPASPARENLSQLRGKYPNFHKYVYYK